MSTVLTKPVSTGLFRTGTMSNRWWKPPTGELRAGPERWSPATFSARAGRSRSVQDALPRSMAISIRRNSSTEFSIQSISKAFVYALVCGRSGITLRPVEVNNTGLAFNSVVAIELNDGHPMNPMVNAGAIATTALVPGATPAEQWEAIRLGLSRFAGRPLELDDEVYRSESETNQRNRAIARLLESYGRIELDPLAVVDVYTKQCALLVTATDLAVMGLPSRTAE